MTPDTNERWGKAVNGLAIDYEILAARLRDLSDRNQIEGAGDLRKWRHSEVRLKISRRSTG